MMNLVKIELYKLFKRKASWVIPAIIVVLAAFYMAIMRKFSSNIPEANLFTSQVMGMLPLMNLGIVVMASGMISNEFSKGTIKFLLIRPYSRAKVIIAKFITTFIYALAFSVVMFVVTFVFCNLLLQAQSPMAAVEGYNNWPAVGAALANLGLNLFLIILYMAIVFLLQTVTRSQALAVGFGVAILFGSSILNLVNSLIMAKYGWFKWMPLNFLNIRDTIGTGYKASMSSAAGLDGVRQNLYVSTWQMGLGLLVTSALIFWLATYVFKKRDVTLS